MRILLEPPRSATMEDLYSWAVDITDKLNRTLESMETEEENKYGIDLHD